MHVIVIGAGIVGMTTAYHLNREGYDVTVVEAGGGAGEETSRANGAQLSYNFVAPLADPTVLPKLPSWLLNRDAPLHFRPRLDAAQWRWSLSFLSRCRGSIALQGTLDLLELGRFSREIMHEIMADIAGNCDFAPSGKLLIYENDDALAGAVRQMEFQKSHGSSYELLDRQGCVDREPFLSDRVDRIAGGIFMPDEDVADCFKVCRELRQRLEGCATFAFNTHIHRLTRSSEGIAGVETSAGPMKADAYVIANGLGAQALSLQAGFNPNIYALKGYSLTYDLTPDSIAPTASISDIATKVVYARLGNRLRVAGMVDIGDNDKQMRARRIHLLRRQAEAFLPRLAAAGAPIEWTGLRPARPGSTPVIGATPCKNLWINAGHGSLGFTLAAGSAALLCDRMAGRSSRIQQHKFAVG